MMKKYCCIILLLVGAVCVRAESVSDCGDWVKKTAKLYRKEGWAVRQGDAMEEQLAKYFHQVHMEDANHLPVYVSGKGIGVGRSFESAERIAQMRALYDLAANISVDVQAQMETRLHNANGSADHVSSSTEVLAWSEQQVASRLTQPVTALTLYRVTKDKNTEVCVIVLYRWEQAINELITDDI